MTALTLARVEWYKTRRRAGVWVGLLLFFGLLTLGLGTGYHGHSTEPASYDGSPGWPALASAMQTLGLLVALVLIVLLTASEKTWRTERQNVIDGLSRTQYFAGKLLLVGAFALLLWIGTLLLGGAFEAANRSLLPAIDTPFISRTHALLMGGMLVFLLLVGSIALFFGSVSSSSGAALALALLFLFAQAPIMFPMAFKGGLWQVATAYLPMQVLSALVSAAAYDPEAMLRAQQRWVETGMPTMLAAPHAALAALAYATVLCAGAWWSIRSRDL